MAASTIEILQKTELFGSLPSALMEKLAQRMPERTFPSGQMLFSRGEDGERLFLILEGRVRASIVTEEGRELSFRQSGIGEVIGEIAVFDGGRRTADATCIGAVRAAVLERADARMLMHSEPEIAATIIAHLCRRLRETSQQLESIALFPIEVRLARFLLALARSQGFGSGRHRIAPGMSQGDLALLIGASRPKVNAAIGVLEEQGVLRRDGDAFSCLIAKLEDLAGAEAA